jgi:hypothetical protein
MRAALEQALTAELEFAPSLSQVASNFGVSY